MPQMICCTIMGATVRLEGLLNEALENIGIWSNYDTKELVISRDKAAQVLSEMIHIIEKGVLLTENGQVKGITINLLTESVDALSKLFYWMTFSNEEELIFK